MNAAFVLEVLETFRLLAPKFEETVDTTVKQWIVLTKPLVCPDRFRRVYDQALALRTAHRMKLAGVGVTIEDPLDGIGDIALGNFMRVNNYSEGQTAIGFNHNIGQYLEDDAELALTEYGIQYMTLRDSMIVPIISSGATVQRRRRRG